MICVMTKNEMLNELRECWGAEVVDNLLLALAGDGIKVMTHNDFMKSCTACGGNWGGMLLTGIKHFWPRVWDAIPDDLGWNPWECIIDVMLLCGVQSDED